MVNPEYLKHLFVWCADHESESRILSSSHTSRDRCVNESQTLLLSFERELPRSSRVDRAAIETKRRLADVIEQAAVVFGHDLRVGQHRDDELAVLDGRLHVVARLDALL